jgi:hypothetical protein
MNKWREQTDRAFCADHVDLRRRRLKIRSLLGRFSLVHDVTERTWVRAIKRPGDRMAERTLLGVRDNHRGPGNRLQRQPLQSDPAAKRENRDGAGNATKHAHESIRRFSIRQSTRPGIPIVPCAVNHRRSPALVFAHSLLRTLQASMADHRAIKCACGEWWLDYIPN